MKIQLALITILVLVACQPTKQADVEKQSTTRPIDIVRGYYNKAEKLKLPLIWDDYINTNADGLKFEVKDSLVFGEDFWSHTLLGVFADTSKYFGFLLSYPADDVIPVLVTFDKEGRKISFETNLNYGCGGSDCEYICDYTDFVVEKDLSFHSTTKSRIKVCEDNTDNMDTTTVEYYVIEKHGKILSDGKVDLNKEKTVEHKMLPFNSPENPLRNIGNGDE